MKVVVALVVGLFTAAMLVALLPLAVASKTARKVVRIVLAIVAAVVLVDELRELFASKPVAKALVETGGRAEAMTPVAKAFQAALAAGGRVA